MISEQGEGQYNSMIIFEEDGTGIYAGEDEFTWTIDEDTLTVTYGEGEVVEFGYEIDADGNLILSESEIFSRAPEPETEP